MTKAGRKIPLFDLGNVVIHVDFRPFQAWLEGRAAPESVARARAFIGSSLFTDFESGAVSRAEFTRRLSQLLGCELTQREVEERFCDIFPGGLVAGMEELLRELAARGPVYALSNTNEMHLDWLLRHHPAVMRNFTKVFASHEMGMRKPLPAIYTEVARELGAAPGNILFFDDLHENVKGALDAGLDAHLFSGAGQVASLLKGNADLDDTK